MDRALAGIIVASAIAFGAWRAGALSRSGAAAAVVVGSLAVAAGWDWALLLLAFFVPSTILSRFRDDVKARRTGRIVEKGGARDAAQVLANGGPFAACALAALIVPGGAWLVLGGGALAAACADTWGTEVGTLSRAEPRLITTWRRVSAGTSGGVTLLGIAATIAGATWIGGTTWLFARAIRIALAIVAGGVAGALLDSVSGALWQSRRWCEACSEPTERHVHTCGAHTQRAGGIAWLDNDGVNVVSSVVGALVAAAIAR